MIGPQGGGAAAARDLIALIDFVVAATKDPDSMKAALADLTAREDSVHAEQARIEEMRSKLRAESEAARTAVEAAREEMGKLELAREAIEAAQASLAIQRDEVSSKLARIHDASVALEADRAELAEAEEERKRAHSAAMEMVAEAAQDARDAEMAARSAQDEAKAIKAQYETKVAQLKAVVS